jgi:hypothetical protein
MPADSKYVTVSPKALAIIRNLQDKAGVMATICRVLDYQNELTTGFIQQNMLSGPGKRDITTLAVVTGLLRRSAHPVKAQNFGGMILSGIGSNVRYAGPHEFGFEGDVNVPEHTRRNSIQDRFDFAGLAVNRFTALRLGILSKKQASQDVQASGKYVFAKKKAKQVVTGGTITVSAYSMHMRITARHCFQRGIEARLSAYGPALTSAIVKQWGQN